MKSIKLAALAVVPVLSLAGCGGGDPGPSLLTLNALADLNPNYRCEALGSTDTNDFLFCVSSPDVNVPDSFINVLIPKDPSSERARLDLDAVFNPEFPNGPCGTNLQEEPFASIPYRFVISESYFASLTGAFSEDAELLTERFGGTVFTREELCSVERGSINPWGPDSE